MGILHRPGKRAREHALFYQHGFKETAESHSTEEARNWGFNHFTQIEIFQPEVAALLFFYWVTQIYGLS